MGKAWSKTVARTNTFNVVIMLPLNTGLDFVRSIHYTKAFSIAMISLVSGGTKGKESNVEFPL